MFLPGEGHRADLLLHDAQYTMEEYKNRVGWGHSSMEDAIQFANLTGVKHLLLSHHDPMRTDAQLNDMITRLKENIHCQFSYEMAVEGLRMEL